VRVMNGGRAMSLSRAAQTLDSGCQSRSPEQARSDVFPANFMRRVVRERLGIAPDEIDGGHCVALSRPKELAKRLDEYRASYIDA
jgi:hypothetical protein